MEPTKPTFNPDDEQSAREAAEAQAALDGIDMPGGHESRERLARRAEELISKAQEILASMDVYGADPNGVEIENEVRAALDEMNEVYVSNKRDEYTYAWVYRDPHNEMGGRYVRRMQALGWEVVSADDPEAREHKFVDGTRVVADCLLMKLRVDRAILLEKRDRILREAQQAGIASRIYDLAARAGTRVYDKLPGFMQDAINETADTRRDRRQAAKAAFHRMNAGGKVDHMLKTGTIPGKPAPGAGAR